jgi:type II secretory pathway predicted ATPase ExeA
MPALDSLPFDGGRANSSPPRHFASAAADEALARCEYLIEHRRPFGIVVGGPGLGKSHILRALAACGPGRSAETPLLLDATAADRRSLLHNLADGLGLALWADRADDGLQAILERLAGLADCRGHQTVLIDQLDRATDSALLALRAVLSSVAPLRSLTVIAASRSPLPAAIADLAGDFADVRIELQTLERRETLEYVGGSLERSPAGRRIEADALDELHRITRGNPRDLERLTRLAQLAAEAEGGDSISLSTIQGALVEAPFAAAR